MWSLYWQYGEVYQYTVWGSMWSLYWQYGEVYQYTVWGSMWGRYWQYGEVYQYTVLGSMWSLYRQYGEVYQYTVWGSMWSLYWQYGQVYQYTVWGSMWSLYWQYSEVYQYTVWGSMWGLYWQYSEVYQYTVWGSMWSLYWQYGEVYQYTVWGSMWSLYWQYGEIYQYTMWGSMWSLYWQYGEIYQYTVWGSMWSLYWQYIEVYWYTVWGSISTLHWQYTEVYWYTVWGSMWTIYWQYIEVNWYTVLGSISTLHWQCTEVCWYTVCCGMSSIDNTVRCVGTPCAVVCPLFTIQWGVLVHRVLWYVLYWQYSEVCWYTVCCGMSSIDNTVRCVGTPCAVVCPLLTIQWEVLVHRVLWYVLYWQYSEVCWYTVCCGMSSIDNTVRCVGTPCAVVCPLLTIQWEVLVHRVLWYVLYWQYSEVCWYTVCCGMSSIDNTVRCVGTPCAVVCPLLTIQWEVLVHRVLWYVLYWQYSEVCWYTVCCGMSSIDNTVRCVGTPCAVACPLLTIQWGVLVHRVLWYVLYWQYSDVYCYSASCSMWRLYRQYTEVYWYHGIATYIEHQLTKIPCIAVLGIWHHQRPTYIGLQLT